MMIKLGIMSFSIFSRHLTKSFGDGQPVNIKAPVYLISPVQNLDGDQVGNQELFDLFISFDYINRQPIRTSRLLFT